MPKTVIPRLMYHAYNLINKGSLEFYYNQVRKVNLQSTSFDKTQISEYLKKWGLNPSLELNPVMNKDHIKQNLLSLDVEKVHSWAYTGGSYGEPLRVPYSKERSLIRTATFKFFNEIGGYSLGDPFVLIRAKKRSSFVKFLRNEEIFIPDDISEIRMGSFVQELKDRRVKVLMGYPTVMYELALYLKEHPEEKTGLNLQSLISVSEPLEDFKRDIIKEVLSCSFVDRYSNEEVGLIAQQMKFGGEYFVNKFGVVVEVLDPVTLKPVEEGQQGKVVVTDLYNDLVSVVRYDTGDLAVAHKYKDGQLLSISNIVGRVSEQIIATNGHPVSSLMLGPYIYKPLSELGTVYQYQFAQTRQATYELRLKAKEGQLKDDLLIQRKK